MLSMRRLQAPSLFKQAALSSMERCALFLFRYLHPDTEEALTKLLHQAHQELGVPFQLHPLLDCRDWPDDAKTGEALEALLARLDELEHPNE
jgi:hypothetical protein